MPLFHHRSTKPETEAAKTAGTVPDKGTETTETRSDTMAETVTKRRKPAIARVREENRATSDEELEDDRIETSEEIARDKRSADWAARPVLKISHLRKDFGDLHVLKDVSFEVRKHEVVVLLGPSGSGKSTLMRCVNLLEQVNDGQIFLDGKDITDPRVKDDEVRKHIGVVLSLIHI